jgi:NACHT domain-containing protein
MAGGGGRSGRRPLVYVVAGTLVAALLTAAIVLVAQGVEHASKWAGVLGAVTALAGFATPLAERVITRAGAVADEAAVCARAAEDLARIVQAQWREETVVRRLQHPWPLPVAWVEGDPGLADHPDLVFSLAVAPGRPGVPGALAGVLDDAAEVYRRLPRRRMVVIGAPGAGKSVFAMVLALQVLEHRAPGEAVPVVFPAGSWDPSAVRLRDWLASYLTDNYQFGAATVRDRRRLVRTLVDRRLILPVLDGLDEMPEPLRGAALDEINRGIDVDQALIVTCRAEEYRRAVDRAGVLTFAAVVHLQPLTVATVTRYLARTTSPRGLAQWRPVFDRLGAEPDGPLAAALSSPLMIALARTVYGDRPRDPGELLGPAFADRAAIENHLLDQLIPAAYAEPARGGSAWTAEDVSGWLGFLARHLAGTGRTDVAWWELEYTVPRLVNDLLPAASGGAVLGLVFGPVTGLVFTAAVLGFWQAAGAGPRTLEDVLRRHRPRVRGHPIGARALSLAIGRWAGLIAGAIAGLAEYRTTGELLPALAGGAAAGLAVGLAAGFFTVSLRTVPSEMRFTTRRGVGRFARQLLVGLTTGTGAAIAAGALIGMRPGVLLGLSCGVGLGVVDGLNVWLDVSTDVTTALSPRSTRRADRLAAVARGASVGVTVGLACFVGFTLAHGWRSGVVHGLAFAVAFAFADRYVGIGATLWGRYLVAKFWLALGGRLPWRFMAFLDDAHKRDLLRRAGAVYQFRHEQLQERLAR